jgi:metal-responsive CopG/Arc/MetJ family transcriptional regulator
MKTAISIPDKLFITAEKISSNLGLARSQLFAKALEEFIQNHSLDDITKKLNEIFKNQSSELDPIIKEMQIRGINKGFINESW